MARSLRIEYEGAVYHVTSRGNARADIFLCDDAFRGRLQGELPYLPLGISKRKALLRHLPLSYIAQSGKSRGNWMREAYCEHGYTMQSIAEFANLHHSTVSRLIKMEGGNAQNKP